MCFQLWRWVSHSVLRGGLSWPPEAVQGIQRLLPWPPWGLPGVSTEGQGFGGAGIGQLRPCWLLIPLISVLDASARRSFDDLPQTPGSGFSDLRCMCPQNPSLSLQPALGPREVRRNVGRSFLPGEWLTAGASAALQAAGLEAARPGFEQPHSRLPAAWSLGPRSRGLALPAPEAWNQTCGPLPPHTASRSSRQRSRGNPHSPAGPGSDGNIPEAASSDPRWCLSLALQIPLPALWTGHPGPSFCCSGEPGSRLSPAPKRHVICGPEGAPCSVLGHVSRSPAAFMTLALETQTSVLGGLRWPPPHPPAQIPGHRVSLVTFGSGRAQPSACPALGLEVGGRRAWEAQATGPRV